jgi:hypothetical protein
LPELLEAGLPKPASRSKFDFTEWANGEAWKFVKGKDYQSSTETFRYNVKRWAKANGYEVECRPFLALDKRGKELPATKADPVALGVRFSRRDGSEAPSRGPKVEEQSELASVSPPTT